MHRPAEDALNDPLLTPDWPAFERALGRSVPPVVRSLYADHEFLLSAPLVVIGPPGSDAEEWDITTFEPADGRASDTTIPRYAVCFAVTCTGDPYDVELGATGDDGPVSVHYHDPDEIERVADSLAEFLSWPREPDSPDSDT